MSALDETCSIWHISFERDIDDLVPLGGMLHFGEAKDSFMNLKKAFAKPISWLRTLILSKGSITAGLYRGLFDCKRFMENCWCGEGIHIPHRADRVTAARANCNTTLILCSNPLPQFLIPSCRYLPIEDLGFRSRGRPSITRPCTAWWSTVRHLSAPLISIYFRKFPRVFAP